MLYREQTEMRTSKPWKDMDFDTCAIGTRCIAIDRRSVAV